jgi:hypothetical protein
LIGTVNEGGSGIAGVTVSAITGTATNTDATDVTGVYLFPEVPAGTYLIRPSSGDDTFYPPVRQATVNADSADENPVPVIEVDEFVRVYYVSGRITDGTNPLPSISISASNGAALASSAITDANGSYVFTNLQLGTYTITPFATNGMFDPPSQMVTLGPKVENLDFVRPPLAAASLSGRVTDGFNGLAGVSIIMGGATAVTDTDGRFTFTNLEAGLYELFAPTNGVGFDPPSRTVLAPATNADFTANPPRVTGVSLEVDGSVRMSALGLPGQSYIIEFATEPMTNWTTISSNVADAIGAFQAVHSTNAASGFYRVRTP